MGSYFRDFYSPKATQQPTIGDTKFSVINQDHMGWLNCDGRLLSTTEYPLLFRVLNYSFGGTSNLFQLPDMRSRVPGAIGQGSNLTLRTLGDYVGTETHTLTINEMPAHTHGSNVATSNTNGNGYTTTNGQHAHTITDLGHAHTYTHPSTDDNTYVAEPGNTPTGSGYGASTGSNTTGIVINSNGDHAHQIFNTGGGAEHNNMQPTLFIGNMFIYSGKLHSGVSKWRYDLNTNIL
jgi:microcystin-dependent protein